MKFFYKLQEPAFTVKNIDVQTVARQKNYKHYYRNGRTKHGFIYVVNGKIEYTFQAQNAKVVSYSSGQLIFIPKNTVYFAKYMENNTQIKIVQFDIAEGELSSHLKEPKIIPLPNGTELIEALFKPMENSLSSHPFYHLSALYNLLWQTEETCFTIPRKYQSLTPALTELAGYFMENKKIPYYANLCGMSEVNFRRLFKEYTGTSPVEYRNKIRLTHAKLKLQSGEYNVSETAESCGFTNLSFFIRLYKKAYGHTPKKQ